MGFIAFYPIVLVYFSIFQQILAIKNVTVFTSVSARFGHSDTTVTLRIYALVKEGSIRRAGQTVRDSLNVPQVKKE